jgi:hypothetical protein
MKITVIFLVSLAAVLTIADLSFAEQTKQGLVQCPAYGYYWRSYKWGWYGAKRTVKTPVEANEIILQFYVPRQGIRIHRVIESPLFYQAEILNSKGVLVDMVIIDKRTGRIRSIY